MRRLMVVIGAAVALGACQAPLIEGDSIFVVRNGTLIDGTGAPERPNMTLIFEGDRIREIVESGSVRIGANVPSIDATGQWITPGFIDTHAHLSGRATVQSTLTTLLAHGITAARATAEVTAYGVEVRERIAEGELAGPSYRVAGALLDGPDTPYGFASVVATPAEAREEVQQQAAAGVDYIKVYTLLSPPIVQAAIEEAHRQGLEVIGHLGATSWDQALELGIDALTHSAIAGMASSMVPADERPALGELFIPNNRFDVELFPTFVEAVDPEVVRQLGRRIAQQGVVLDPNLVLMEAILRGDDVTVFEALMPPERWSEFAPHPYSAGWSDSERAAALEALPLFFDAIRVFHEEGALITAGTDIGNPWMTPGVSFHRELQLLSAAGLDNAAVLQAATRNGAIALGMLEDVGTVEVGKRADIVILSADPLADIRNTAEIVAVYQAGRRVG